MRSHVGCPGFDLHRCRRCGHLWSSNAKGLVINSFCPTCIPKITHVLTDDTPTTRSIPSINMDRMRQARTVHLVNELRSGAEQFVLDEKQALQKQRRTA